MCVQKLDAIASVTGRELVGAGRRDGRRRLDSMSTDSAAGTSIAPTRRGATRWVFFIKVLRLLVADAPVEASEVYRIFWMGVGVVNGVYAANICWSCDQACVIPTGARVVYGYDGA